MRLIRFILVLLCLIATASVARAQEFSSRDHGDHSRPHH